MTFEELELDPTHTETQSQHKAEPEVYTYPQAVPSNVAAYYYPISSIPRAISFQSQ